MSIPAHQLINPDHVIERTVGSWDRPMWQLTCSCGEWTAEEPIQATPDETRAIIGPHLRGEE